MTASQGSMFVKMALIFGQVKSSVLFLRQKRKPNIETNKQKNPKANKQTKTPFVCSLPSQFSSITQRNVEMITTELDTRNLCASLPNVVTPNTFNKKFKRRKNTFFHVDAI